MTKLPSFDELRKLAEHNPTELDRLQKQLCKEVIESSSPQNQHQLYCIQHNLEQQLAQCKNPYHRCQITMSILLKKFATFSSVINNFEEYKRKKAKVIDFKIK